MAFYEFGENQTGATDRDINDYIWGSKYNCPIPARLRRIYLFIASVGAEYVKCAVYDTSFNLVAETEEKYISAGDQGHWFDIDPDVDVEAGDYWLVAWAGGPVDIRYDGGAAGQGCYKSQTYGSWPDPLSPSTNSDKYTIVCEYEAKTGGRGGGE